MFVSFSRDLCSIGFLSRTCSVGTGYECRTHGTLGKSSIITFTLASFFALTLSEKEYLLVSACADVLFFRQLIRANHYCS